MKKAILFISFFCSSLSFAGVHVQQGDPSLTIGSMTLTGAAQGIKFADGTSQTTAGGAGGSGIVSPATFTWTNNFGIAMSTAEIGSSSSITGPAGTNSFHGAYASIRSSGTTAGLLIDSRGIVAGGPQQQVGALTVRNDAASGGPASTLAVFVDSTTDAQTGTGEVEIWSLSNTHNDPIFWIHRNSSNSSPEMRWDSPSPNMEMVCTSTDNTHGRGKWEPYATPAGSEILQVNSRAWDNTTFENVAYWEPLDIQPSVGLPGLYLRAQDLTNDSGVLASSTTAAVNWFTLNNHTVGLQGPANTTASWAFTLPHTFTNVGQVLYQATNSSPWNWEFTVGGSSGQVLTNGGTGSPFWASSSTFNTASTGTWTATQTFSSATVTNLNVGTVVSTQGVTLTNSCGYIIGTVVQSSQAIDITSVVTSGTGYNATNSSATITPKCATDQILFTVTGSVQATITSAHSTSITVTRNGSDLSTGARSFMTISGNITGVVYSAIPLSILDSPSTVSPVTYDVQLKSTVGGEGIWNPNVDDTRVRLDEIAR